MFPFPSSIFYLSLIFCSKLQIPLLLLPLRQQDESMYHGMQHVQECPVKTLPFAAVKSELQHKATSWAPCSEMLSLQYMQSTYGGSKHYVKINTFTVCCLHFHCNRLNPLNFCYYILHFTLCMKVIEHFRC